MIKNLTEIEKYPLKKSKNLSVLINETENTKFLNNNYLKALKVGFLYQVYNMNEVEILDSKLVIRLEINFNNINNNNKMATFLATDDKSS